jgi:hypothetical protein
MVLYPATSAVRAALTFFTSHVASKGQHLDVDYGPIVGILGGSFSNQHQHYLNLVEDIIVKSPSILCYRIERKLLRLQVEGDALLDVLQPLIPLPSAAKVSRSVVRDLRPSPVFC